MRSHANGLLSGSRGQLRRDIQPRARPTFQTRDLETFIAESRTSRGSSTVATFGIVSGPASFTSTFLPEPRGRAQQSRRAIELIARCRAYRQTLQCGGESEWLTELAPQREALTVNLRGALVLSPHPC